MALHSALEQDNRLVRATPPTGLPVLLPSPSFMRAAANAPAKPIGAHVARLPTDASLPRFTGGSASALLVSRPARLSLTLRPACSLNRPRRPFSIEVLQTTSLPPRSAPTATGWSDSCRAGFAPAKRRRLSTAHGKIRGIIYVSADSSYSVASTSSGVSACSARKAFTPSRTVIVCCWNSEVL